MSEQDVHPGSSRGASYAGSASRQSVPQRSHRLRTSTSMKLIVVGVVLLVLSIGAMMIRSTVSERLGRSLMTQHEIAGSWGAEQIIVGPALKVSNDYTCLKTTGEGEDKKTEPEICTRYRQFLPRTLDWAASLEPEVRKRGLYRALLYEGRLHAVGEFVVPEELARAGAENPWFARSLEIGVADLKGLVEVEVTIAGRPMEINGHPSRGALGLVNTNPLGRALEAGERIPFTVEMRLRGSKSLSFVPSAATAKVEIASSWPSPKFVGSYLPTSRTVEDGFSASWMTTTMRRFAGELDYNNLLDLDIAASHSFGVELIFEAGPHQKVDRALKYAVLLVAMVLGTVFLMEMLSTVLLHPIQYLLIGCAKLLFFLLLLALSEHLGFVLAFGIASFGCLVMIVSYAQAQLHSARATGLLSLVLTFLFSYLFVTLSAEKYALLIGAVGLFVMLALVMFATKRINWYSARVGEEV